MTCTNIPTQSKPLTYTFLIHSTMKLNPSVWTMLAFGAYSFEARVASAFSRSTFVTGRNSNGMIFSRRSYSETRLSMKLQTAIVGLPNVGKSTLFNALTETQGAEAANYPFCTIEPNVGIVSVPDSRLDELGRINNSAKIIPATLEFVDVAGLVKGASAGEGLGNQFLATIRQCDAITHVVRCFDDENVIHVDGSVDPVRDAELINLELVFADSAQVDKRFEKVKKDRKADPKEASALEKVKAFLDEGQPARNAELDEDEELLIKALGLLTRKAMIYAANVADADLADGNDMVKRLKDVADAEGAKLVIVSAQVGYIWKGLNKYHYMIYLTLYLVH